MKNDDYINQALFKFGGHFVKYPENFAPSDPEVVEAREAIKALITKTLVDELSELTKHINAFEEHMEQPNRTLQNVNKVIFKRLNQLGTQPESKDK